MGTRAIYQFRDGDDECYVYKHYDNYPQGAVHFIEEAKSMVEGEEYEKELAARAKIVKILMQAELEK